MQRAVSGGARCKDEDVTDSATPSRAEVSRHRSMQVLADYVRVAELFRDHAGEGFL